MTDPPRTLVPAVEVAAALGLPPPTDEQVAVIEAPMEPMLVVAGAGAGKTETMASRVVWLVVNRFVDPDQILGLTFTRKAAQELAARIRRRLSMLAGAPAMRRWDPEGAVRTRIRSSDPLVSTYHAYAGRLVSDYGLLLPVEPTSTLLSETELWQLAFSVVANWDRGLQTPKTPTGVTESVLKLYGEIAEHMVDLDDLASAGTDLYELIDTLPKGKGQRGGPSQKLRNIQAVIDERRALIPLVVELGEQMRAQSVLDFGSQMSLAARLVTEHPEVAAAERAAARVVLLDEYQDTGHSQRILLSHLFTGGTAVTAVGDPIQSIYGWRGASAANLPRFTTDFRCSDGSPARRLELLTSWRNARHALDIANEASAELRSRGVPVGTLRARPDAPAGSVDLMLAETVDDEREWCADQVAARYRDAEDSGRQPPTVAILVRRNEDSAPLAAALERRGIPVEVVGIGGLLHVPEVADIVATLALMADPMAGTAAMRLLTGPRWQIGAHDLAALWRRATDLAAIEFGGRSSALTTTEQLAEALDAAIPADISDRAGLGDALADPGPESLYSPEGYRRITQLGREIERLRSRIGIPLPELVAEVERVSGVAIEAQVRARRMRGNTTGREHLDAFATYVADYAGRSGATLPGLLAFLDSAVVIEKGLEPGKIEPTGDRVQILTVHAAKGLEWDVVALPHLAKGVFPSSKADGTWLGSARELLPELRGDLADRAGGEGFPPIDLRNLADRKQLDDAIEDHKEALRQRKLEEDRRLLYVALTRTKDALLISGHQWGDGSTKPRGPSPFLVELHGIVEQLQADNGESGSPESGLVIHEWCPDPDDGAENPLAAKVIAKHWPPDGLGPRRDPVAAGAALVLAAQQASGEPTLFDAAADAADPDADPLIAEWESEVEVLLAERDRGIDRRVEIAMPQNLSVSQMVELDSDERAFARRLRRPLPYKPNPLARRGTAFHAWIERRFGATRLLDLDELPGAADAADGSDADLAELQEKFLASPWAARSPSEVEVPFETVIGDTIIRGRIDAVFAEPDGGWFVVDWKTGAPPTDKGRKAVDIQLAAYRVAWSELTGVPIDKVRAGFHYVRAELTVEPADLPDRDEMADLLRGTRSS
jgi:DNA helicase-2/ATP-dependent DNA helicase PcrA